MRGEERRGRGEEEEKKRRRRGEEEKRRREEKRKEVRVGVRGWEVSLSLFHYLFIIPSDSTKEIESMLCHLRRIKEDHDGRGREEEG